MFKYSKGFDPERGLVFISIRTNLLIKYYSEFEKLFELNISPHLPNNSYIERGREDDEVIVLIPVDLSMAKIYDNSAELDLNVSSLYEGINIFISTSISSKLKNTEFIPLDGYPVEDLQGDIKRCIEAQRDFCIISDYETFETKANFDSSYQFEQYEVEFLSEEFCDITSLIMQGKMRELKKNLLPKLTMESWI